MYNSFVNFWAFKLGKNCVCEDGCHQGSESQIINKNAACQAFSKGNADEIYRTFQTKAIIFFY